MMQVTPTDDLQAVLDAAPKGTVIYLAEGEYRQIYLHLGYVRREPGL